MVSYACFDTRRRRHCHRHRFAAVPRRDTGGHDRPAPPHRHTADGVLLPRHHRRRNGGRGRAGPECLCREQLHPDALVDAILAKRNLGTRITDAPVVVGIGPGFTAGEDCHAVVETMRGHTLGRVIYRGSALPNTNIPGLIGGYAGERVLRAPADGIFTRILDIGDEVQPGDIAGTVNGQPMKCTIGGVVRGILPSGTPVHLGMKSGDVDPRCQPEYCTTASDKALAVGGGALEAILHLTGALR